MVQAFGKVILFGEHAVVHGQPAIAMPLRAISVTVKGEKTAEGGLRLVSDQNPEGLPISDATLDQALRLPIELALKHFNINPTPNLLLRLHSTIPVASGFGSGAALSTALIRAVAETLQLSLERETLNALVYEIEKLHHGTPSGIDNTVIVYETPIYFVKDQPIQHLTVGKPLHFLVATLPHATPTYITVGDVAKLYAANSERISAIFKTIGQLVEWGRQAITEGDAPAVGHLMQANQHHLQTLSISDNLLDQLCDAALDAGAMGAKLSGGGRGGNMIALVTPDLQAQVEAALLANGAVRVISTILS